MSSNLAQSFYQVRQRLEAAIKNNPQQRSVPTILAVSKTHSSSKIAELYKLGQIEFAENYLQEALLKQQELLELPIVWHFIGPIQSNKTKAIAEHFSWVHSLDRLKVAERLNQARAGQNSALNVCLQVNINREPNKSGCLPEELLPLAQQVLQLPHLQLRGLMAIPKASSDPVEQRENFAKVAALQQQLCQTLGIQLDTLSMGMSGDLEAAVVEGATYLRVGTALFGSRN